MQMFNFVNVYTIINVYTCTRAHPYGPVKIR